MPPASKPLKKESRCVYCGSISRGKGCRYGPQGTHFHPDDPTKCAYCGSTSYGRGCRVNPFNDIHVHGPVFNQLMKEEMDQIVHNEFLLHLLFREYTEFEAFKLNLIDDQGNKIKDPQTIEESNALSPTVQTIIRIKKYLGPKVELLDSLQTLQEATHDHPFNTDAHIAREKFQTLISEATNNLLQVLQKAEQAGIPPEQLSIMLRN